MDSPIESEKEKGRGESEHVVLRMSTEALITDPMGSREKTVLAIKTKRDSDDLRISASSVTRVQSTPRSLRP